MRAPTYSSIQEAISHPNLGTRGLGITSGSRVFNCGYGCPFIGSFNVETGAREWELEAEPYDAPLGMSSNHWQDAPSTYSSSAAEK